MIAVLAPHWRRGIRRAADPVANASLIGGDEINLLSHGGIHDASDHIAAALDRAHHRSLTSATSAGCALVPVPVLVLAADPGIF
jgi:hypothetical protein